MRANQDVYKVRTMCRVLGVSPSGYYAWCDRGASARAKADELLAAGIGVGRKRVARLMRELGLVGVSRRKSTRTTRRATDAAPAPDLMQHTFSAQAPNCLWVVDITYVPTWAGFIYLTVVVAVFSRRVVGWSMANHLRTELVLEALNMALWQRRSDEVIHHSDQGTQYTSIAFGKRCRAFGVRPSMGSVGDCYDNAMVENFFATLECECIEHEGPFCTQAEAKLAVFRFIEGWYNLHRRHSSLGYLSPHAYEQAVLATEQAEPRGTPGYGSR